MNTINLAREEIFSGFFMLFVGCRLVQQVNGNHVVKTMTKVWEAI